MAANAHSLPFSRSVQSATLSDLLALHDKDFIRAAYLAVLGREPDARGLDYYLNRIRRGIGKLEVLGQLRNSAEGRDRPASLPGLDKAIRRDRWNRLPLIGAMLRGGRDRRIQTLQAIENQLYLLNTATNTRFELLGDSLSSLRDEQDRNIESTPNQATKPTNRPISGIDAFLTICSKNFIAHARVLHKSVHAVYPHARFFLVLCDKLDGTFDPALEPFEMIYLEELGIPDLDGMASRYNITEFNTSVKPFAFTHIFSKYSFESVAYVDPDILFLDRMQELDQMLADGAEAVLTPHILQPAEQDEVHDGKMLLYGIYNLGFLALRNTPKVRDFLAWWGRRLERQCVIRLEEGIFVDQKWADLLPAFVSGTRVMHHSGYNVAYWNLPQRTVTQRDGKWYVNGTPLRFVHFSGNKIDDPNVFSRHSQQVTIENIGDLRELLNYYRDQVFAEGHAFYRGLPYAYSWNGESGINLHTPASLDVASKSMPNALEPVTGIEDSSAANSDPSSTLSVVAQRMPSPSESEVNVRSGLGAKKLLFIDWSTPRPDRDAGSVTAFYLLKIYSELGYDVTFIPSDLQYLGEYTDAVRAMGIQCLHQEEITSVQNHLQLIGETYDFVLICRAPIAGLYIPTIREFALNAKIILNTSDLHYLRDLREAEISGDAQKLEAAKAAKQWELDIIRSCDITIVMSSVELNIMKDECPNIDVRLIPLMFVEISKDCPSYEERSDFLFIGGFPHAPNVDAVIYFCNEILPLVRRTLPGAKFHIVGNAPPPEVLALANLEGVVVHGYVKNISDLFKKVRISVAPLRYGAGIKGKVGTSLSYGVPAVATSMAVEGMDLETGKNVLVADEPREFAHALVNLYRSKHLWERLSESGRAKMLEDYSLNAGLKRISMLMDDIDPLGRKLHLLH